MIVRQTTKVHPKFSTAKNLHEQWRVQPPLLVVFINAGLALVREKSEKFERGVSVIKNLGTLTTRLTEQFPGVSRTGFFHGNMQARETDR
jgi:trans-aconitate methyltransferase